MLLRVDGYKWWCGRVLLGGMMLMGILITFFTLFDCEWYKTLLRGEVIATEANCKMLGHKNRIIESQLILHSLHARKMPKCLGHKTEW